MSYRLKVKEPLAEGIRRIALDQIEIAENELRANADPDAGVHNARRALKRLRALLRLVRPGLDDAVYRRESQRFAETGRLLAGERDRHVMQQTLKKLSAEAPSLPADLQTTFGALLGDGAATRTPAADPRQKALAKLQAARKAFAGDVLSAIEMVHVFQGLEKVYRKARRLHRHSQGGASDEEFHALRKSVQQHWRHMQLLSRAWPDALSARAAEAKALSQLLGEDHDLAVLRAFAAAHADALPADGLAVLAAVAKDVQAQLRQRMRFHGDRLFAEKADDLIERLRAYWTAAEGMTELAARAEVGEAPPSQPQVSAAPARRAARRLHTGPRKARAPRKAVSS
jgi:CHAD domain-containing protein